MNNNTKLLLGSSALALMAQPLAAQDTPALSQSAEPQSELEAQDGAAPEPIIADGTIVVRGQRIKGQLDVDQAPVAEYEEEDIAAFGAGSIEELAEAIENDTGSPRGRGGRPVFLVNGIRIASFREFRSYPPEAVRKVEVLPEEVATRFGFPPDRRVVNFILKDDFSSKEIELEYQQPGRGGFSRTEQEFTLLKITGGGRLNVNLERESRSDLTEAERGVVVADSQIADVPGDPDASAFRTLLADTQSYEATVNYAKAFIESGRSVSLNATFERDESESLSGLDTVTLTDPGGNQVLRTFNADDPLERRTTSDTVSSAASLTGQAGAFQLVGTVDGSYAAGTSLIDQRVDTSRFVEQAAAGTLALDAPLTGFTRADIDRAETQTYTVSSKITARGGLGDLPAGEFATTFDIGYDWDRIESEDTRTLGLTGPVQLTRGEISGGASFTAPITSTRRGVWDNIGSLSLNGQVRFRELSDFGTLFRWNAGLTWDPTDKLSLTATYINAEAPPSLAQLGNPEIIDLNVPTFDFVTGEAVLANIITGGNPDLVAETQSDWSFGANWELPFLERGRFSVTYTIARSDDVTSALPTLTAPIEAAFADRIVRDANGTLLSIDRRPVTFAEVNSRRLDFNLNHGGQVGKARPAPEPAEGEGRARGGRGGRGGAGNPAAFFGGGRDDGRGRYFISAFSTIQLENEILIAPGVPVLDQLDGEGAARSRYFVGSEAGLFWNGWGSRLSARYFGSFDVDGGDTAGSTDLFYDDYATVDLRVWADLGEVLKSDSEALKNLRLLIRADNLFDARRNVTDQDGNTPLSFQPFLIDPIGRYVGVELRKVF